MRRSINALDYSQRASVAFERRTMLARAAKSAVIASHVHRYDRALDALALSIAVPLFGLAVCLMMVAI